MNDRSTTIESRIEALKPDITLKNQKRLRLGSVIRVARRLDSLSIGCESCLGHFPAISHLVDSIKNVEAWQLSDWKAYYRSLDGLIKHLKTAHHLSEENEKMVVWLPVGTGIGIALGVAFHNVVLGLLLGIAGGVAFGAILDGVAHKQGRVI